MKDGGTSIVVFEQWMQTRDQALLDQIDAYNQEDCIATLLLRDWLLERSGGGARGVRAVPAARAGGAEADRRRTRSSAPSSGRELLDAGEELAAQLLDYHDRERKPVWWAFFDRVEMTPEELVEDSESIGRLELVGEPEPVDEAVARVHVHVPGAGAQDRQGTGARSTRRRGKAPGEILELDREARAARAQARPDARRRCRCPRRSSRAARTDTDDQEDALVRLGRSLLAGDDRYPALESILRPHAVRPRRSRRSTSTR